MKKVECKFCPNNSCYIKKNYYPDMIDIWEKEKYQNLYHKGEPIFETGSSILGIYFIQDGMVEEYIVLPDEKRRTIRYIGNGQTFGTISMENEVYTIGAFAKEDTLVCFFENILLYDMIRTNPIIVFDLMHYYSHLYCKTGTRLLTNSAMNLREKIAAALIYLVDNFGITAENELKDCFSRKDIANLTSTTAEQVSRQLSDFENDKLIEKRNKKIAILQLDKLKHIIQDYLV